jgi:hypothetical protein
MRNNYRPSKVSFVNGCGSSSRRAGGRKTQARVRAPLDIREWVTCAAGMNERRVGCFLGGWHATSFGLGWKRSRSPVFLGEAGHRRAPNASLIWLRHFGCWFPLFSLCSAGGFRIARARFSERLSPCCVRIKSFLRKYVYRFVCAWTFLCGFRRQWSFEVF